MLNRCRPTADDELPRLDLIAAQPRSSAPTHSPPSDYWAARRVAELLAVLDRDIGCHGTHDATGQVKADDEPPKRLIAGSAYPASTREQPRSDDRYPGNRASAEVLTNRFQRLPLGAADGAL
jgi:hypothetical protein